MYTANNTSLAPPKQINNLVTNYNPKNINKSNATNTSTTADTKLIKPAKCAYIWESLSKFAIVNKHHLCLHEWTSVACVQSGSGGLLLMAAMHSLTLRHWVFGAPKRWKRVPLVLRRVLWNTRRWAPSADVRVRLGRGAWHLGSVKVLAFLEDGEFDGKLFVGWESEFAYYI